MKGTQTNRATEEYRDVLKAVVLDQPEVMHVGRPATGGEADVPARAGQPGPGRQVVLLVGQRGPRGSGVAAGPPYSIEIDVSLVGTIRCGVVVDIARVRADFVMVTSSSVPALSPPETAAILPIAIPVTSPRIVTTTSNSSTVTPACWIPWGLFGGMLDTPL